MGNDRRKKLLSICIPNYNRISEYKRLLKSCINQIEEDSLEEYVSICICDDHSSEDPTDFTNQIINDHKNIEINYKRSSKNMGMGYNFRESVLMSDSIFSWIIGNDDEPERGGLKKAVEVLTKYGNSIDFLVTPFDIRDEDGTYISTTFPLGDLNQMKLFDSRIPQEYDELISMVKYDSGFFVFLSNLIFRRASWDQYKQRFEDKLNSIFLQVYMHIQKMEDGAIYMYYPEKIIINHSDDETNNTIKRKSQMAIGLNNVVDYFYKGERAEELKKAIVDCYIYDLVWDTHGNNTFLDQIKAIDSPRNNCYKKYFVPSEEIPEAFSNKKVLIWGAGNYGHKSIIKVKDYCENITVFDSDEKKAGTSIQGYPVQNVSSLPEYYDNHSIVVVASQFYLLQMITKLNEWGISDIAIIS